MNTQKCVEKIPSAWGFHQCRSRGSHEHEGRLYCLRHHPPAVLAKREAKSRKWESKWNAEGAQRTETNRRLAAYEPLLHHLKRLVNAIERMPSNAADGLADEAREAIKAIEGEEE